MAHQRHESSALLVCVVCALLMSLLQAGPVGDRPGTIGDSSNGQQTETIEVRRPLLIGFFPTITGVDAGGSTAQASALEHFAWAMETARRCLESTQVEVLEIHAQVVVVQDQDRRDQLSLIGTGTETIGCYLVTPGRQAQVIRATAGPSSLIVLCAAAASVYFDVPQCCPEGFRCCADGSVKDETVPCDG